MFSIKTKSLILILGLVLIFTGCGGGGDSTPIIQSTTQTGYIVDSNVSGMYYECKSNSNSIDTNGTSSTGGAFTYKVGNVCTFKIGDFTIGSVTTSGTNLIVTPKELMQANDYNETKVIALAVLLQSLDSDGNASNGIDLAAASQGFKGNNPSFDFVSADENAIFNFAQTYFSGAKQITIDGAKAHLLETLKKIGIDPNGTNQNNGTGSSLPDSVASKVITMEFNYAQNGAPYADGDKVLFTFSSSGELMLTEQYTVVANTFATVGSEYVWTDTANSVKYALSLLNSQIYEVNLNALDGTFFGQFTPVVDTNTTPDSNTTNPDTNTTATFQAWKRTGTSNKGSIATIYTLWASSASKWDIAEMKATTDDYFPEDQSKLQVTLVSSSAEEVVYQVACDTTCTSYNFNATYTYSLMSEAELASKYGIQVPNISATPPQTLTNLSGHYAIANTVGSNIAGNMSLDLTIDTNGSIHYVVKDNDDNSTLFDNTITWDGEKDDIDRFGNVYLDEWSNNGGMIKIAPVNGWFEFHLYVPLYYPGVGNTTSDAQWNVPYLSN